MKWALCLFFGVISTFSIVQGSMIEECQVVEKKLQLLIPRKEIQKQIAIVASELNEYYQGEEVVLLMILKGSLCFVSDLLQELHGCFDLKAITSRSYGNSFVSGNLTIEHVEQLNLTNKHVLVVDDIFDSGKTLTNVLQEIQKLNPASLKSIVLLNKDAPRIDHCIEPDWSVFKIENRFIVGYGLDYKEHLREMPGIYWLELD